MSVIIFFGITVVVVHVVCIAYKKSKECGGIEILEENAIRVAYQNNNIYRQEKDYV